MGHGGDPGGASGHVGGANDPALPVLHSSRESSPSLQLEPRQFQLAMNHSFGGLTSGHHQSGPESPSDALAPSCSVAASSASGGLPVYMSSKAALAIGGSGSGASGGGPGVATGRGGHGEGAGGRASTTSSSSLLDTESALHLVHPEVSNGATAAPSPRVIVAKVSKRVHAKLTYGNVCATKCSY